MNVIIDFRMFRQLIQGLMIYDPDITPEQQMLFMEVLQQRLLTNPEDYYII